MVKVSVIIPVYNAEMYLRQCLDSVCGQTLQEIEIICVDDGSTDDSYSILEEYKAKDERITLFRQENKYAGAARNHGKKYATGEYMIFWDSDDFFQLTALEKMYERAKLYDADICVCGGSHYYEALNTVVPYTGYLQKSKIPEDPVFNINTNAEYILNFTNEAAWNKLYKRSFIESLSLDFQEVRNGNDVYFTVNAMCFAERITTLTDQLVTYRKNQTQSLVGTLYKSPLTPFKAWADAADNLIAHDRFPEKSFTNKASGAYAYLLRNISNAAAFEEAFNFLRSEGLARTHVCVREDGYYYTSWHNEMIEHLIKDDISEFKTFLSYLNYIELTEKNASVRIEKQKAGALKKQIKDLNSKVKKSEKEIQKLKEKNKAQSDELKDLKKANKKLEKEMIKIRSSKSFKLGKAILWLPIKIKRAFKKVLK